MRCASARWMVLGALALLAACAAEPARESARAPKPAATTPGPAAKTTAPAGAAAARPVGPRPAPEKIDQDSPYGQALKHLKANQLPDAEAGLLAAAKANPQASGPQTNLGILYVRTNRKPEARAAFARAVAINPANPVAQNWRGVLAREAGDYATAEQAYRDAIAADPGYAPAHLNLAILYDLYLKRPADAVAAYRQYEQATDGKDVRTAVWIGEIEATTSTTTAAPAPKATPEPAKPAAGKPMGGASP